MKVWKSALIASLAGLLLGAGAVYVWLNQPLSLDAESVEVSIEPGTPPRRIAEAWVQAGVRTSSFMLFEWFRWFPCDGIDDDFQTANRLPRFCVMDF